MARSAKYVMNTATGSHVDWSSETIPGFWVENKTAANETFVGGLGDDTLVGGGGKDVMYGGAGIDTLQISGVGNLDLTPVGVNSRVSSIERDQPGQRQHRQHADAGFGGCDRQDGFEPDQCQHQDSQRLELERRHL